MKYETPEMEIIEFSEEELLRTEAEMDSFEPTGLNLKETDKAVV